MATTALIFENILIGSFSWCWVVGLLIRCGAISVVQLKLLASTYLHDSPAAMGVIFIIVIYPVGSMMNTVCLRLANRILSVSEERKALRFLGLAGVEFAVVEMFVAQNGSVRVSEEILSFRSFMRIARAAVPHSFLLACVLLSFGWAMVPWTLVLLGLLALSVPACVYAYRARIEEIVAAYLVLSGRFSDAVVEGAAQPVRKPVIEPLGRHRGI
jgi:hypothetical protein